MALTIRERSHRIAPYLERVGVKLREIASATGISKSAVHRHQQAIARRNRYPESSWWETPAGSAWLKRLVRKLASCPRLWDLRGRERNLFWAADIGIEALETDHQSYHPDFSQDGTHSP